jgi:Uma2 family endonuclease
MARDDSLPEPDVALCQGSLERFAQEHPRGEEVLLVVEIAQTSQALDRGKAAIYAKAMVPAFWLLDLSAKRLEVRLGPQADGLYRMSQILGREDEVEVPATGIRLRVASLLP